MWGHKHTLNDISVVMVKPCVMIGSSSGGRPFQQSSSIQRHPVSNTCLYISTDDRPVNWPTERGKHRQRSHVCIYYHICVYESAFAYLLGMCCVMSWWNSGTGVGSYHRWCPTSQEEPQSSPPHQDTLWSPSGRSDLLTHGQVRKKNTITLIITMSKCVCACVHLYLYPAGFCCSHISPWAGGLALAWVVGKEPHLVENLSVCDL